MTQLPEGRAPIDPEDLAKLAGHPSTWQAEIEILTAKLAKAEARKPVVKPLVWVQCEHETAFVAITKAKTYRVKFSFDLHVWMYDGRAFEHIDMAKSACQADYERKILDAIEWKESE